ncbi:MAG: glyoxalase [Planctomycetota bacterium]|nr:MAG: glyoxalase [Planctomycetota bacterium]
MSDFNSQHNRVCWVDIPVLEVARAATFYRQVLAIEVAIESYEGMEFGVLNHGEGSGGCLVCGDEWIPSREGTLVYYNADGRIRDAVAKVTENGGEIITAVQPIGPHGFRAIVLDSEGNRIALHSNSDS